MHRRGLVRRSLPILVGSFALTVGAASSVPAQDWAKLRESYEGALKANEKRIADIEARERGIADPRERADKITRDKISSTRVSLRGAGRGKGLADGAEKASGDKGLPADLVKEQGAYLDVVTNEWGGEGAERKKLREAMATSQKNLERANASLSKAAETAHALAQPSDVLEKAVRIDAAVTEAGDRLRARWQLEQAARERDAKQREREAAERARSSK